MSIEDSDDRVGTFGWATGHLDEEKAARAREREEQDSLQREEEERAAQKARAHLETPGGAADEIERLSERVAELEGVIEELRDDLSRLYRQLGGIGRYND